MWSDDGADGGPFLWVWRISIPLHACMELCSQYGTRFFFGKTHSVPSLDAVVQLYSWSGPRTTINFSIVRQTFYCEQTDASCLRGPSSFSAEPYNDGATGARGGVPTPQ